MLGEGAERFCPQFATHNAHTLAAVIELAGNRRGFEFQKLHGMGETLYRDLATVENGRHPLPRLRARGQPQGAPALSRPPPARGRARLPVGLVRQEAGKTVVFVSHDLALVERFCDRCLLQRNGQAQLVGPSHDVIDVYRETHDLERAE